MTAKPESGFTLIEALVALALGAVIMAAILTTVRLASNTATRLATAAETDETLSRLGDLMAGDAAHALALPVTTDGLVFAGDPQSARFAMLPRPRPDSVDPEPVIVTYRVRTGTPTRLTRSETRLGEAEGTALPVWDVPQAIALRYLDSGGKWQSRWMDDSAPPRALGLVIGSDNSARPAMAAAFLPLLPLACADGAEGCGADSGAAQ